MNRRRFFQIALATPLITPLFLASKNRPNDIDLYLVSNEPQLSLPSLLNELSKSNKTIGKKFSFVRPHPSEEKIKKRLSSKGWNCVPPSEKDHWNFSFHSFVHKISPSFTLVQNGRIRDIRDQNLFLLWKDMNQSQKPSTWLTIASLKKRQRSISKGDTVIVYKDGEKIDRLSLDNDGSRYYNAREGRITINLKGGKAWISESPCRHNICLMSPSISQSGERIICAPNHFFIEIEGPRFIDTVIG